MLETPATRLSLSDQEKSETIALGEQNQASSVDDFGPPAVESAVAPTGAASQISSRGLADGASSRRHHENMALDRPDTRLLVQALDAADLGLWDWDRASGVAVWNERLEELHGIASDNFGGTFDHWLATLHPADREDCRARMNGALRQPGPFELTLRVLLPDGSLRWIEHRGCVLVDGDGSPTGATGVAFDVTRRERTQLEEARERSEDRRLVRAMQQALLPEKMPMVPGFTTATRYESARGPGSIGGDWYAVVGLPEGRLGVGIGDVAGHGIAAVAEMAHARFGLRSLALGRRDPAHVIGRLSQAVHTFAPDTLVTALYGIIDPVRQTWTSSIAGHCPPVLRSPDGSAVLLERPPGPPLGFAPRYKRYTQPMHPEQTLVLYTDGLVERRNEPIDVGTARLVAACGVGPDDPDALADHLMQELLTSDSNDDDVAIVVVRFDRVAPPQDVRQEGRA